VAAAVRSLNHAGVFTGGDVILWEVDPFYHVRRIWLTVLHYPHVPVFDPYLCFPEGAVCPWPPGFDFALATLVKVLAGPAAGLLDVKTITAWAIPWLGGITCAVAAWRAGRLWGSAAALAAGLALAVTPAQVDVGLIGRVDHHVIESLFFAILAGRFLGNAEATGLGAVGTGLAFALSHLFWTGTPIFGVVTAGAGILLGWSAPGAAGARMGRRAARAHRSRLPSRPPHATHV
jgi:dolichyl-diphosphooligosaccharide--protein glycosyltransferase